MHKALRAERADFNPAKRMRGRSMSSEVTSHSSNGMYFTPTSVNPDPAYIAVSAASQLLAAEFETDEVTISPTALAQLNSFLDHILFNILLAAKSTKLSLLRPAVYSVLKPKLGKAALGGADEELREYLGDEGDDDESLESDLETDSKREFDLELAWKLARLRCMVYSRIGDLEEDDEDEYIERENLDERGGRPRRFSSHPSMVTTASAIFLTSVIEFLAEQALAHTADATQRKLSKSRAGQGGHPDATTSLFLPPNRIVVGDVEMRYLGRDSPLQKLWRGWRHQVRPPTDPASRPISPESPIISVHSHKESMNTINNVPASEVQHRPSVTEVLQENDPAWIPLPMSHNDIEEIEVPALGLADEEEAIAKSELEISTERGRPKSLERLPSGMMLRSPVHPDGNMRSEPGVSARPPIQHRRSRSLPSNPTEKLYTPWAAKAINHADATESFLEGRRAADMRMEEESIDLGKSPCKDTYEEGGVAAGFAAKPGTFPRATVADEPERVSGIDIQPLRADDEFSVPSAAVDSEVSSGRTGASRSPTAQQANDYAAVKPSSASRTHPPRISSKNQAENAEHQEQSSLAVLTNASEPPSVLQEHARLSNLAPLREVAEQAEQLQESSEEDLPVSPGTEGHKRQGQIICPAIPRDVRHRAGSGSSHDTSRSSSSSKLLGFDREQQTALEIGSERAAVQRIYPPTGAADGSGSTTRPSTAHSSKEKRPGTGSSHISSLKQAALGRASLDTTAGNSKGPRSSVGDDEKKQSLENLIRSEETLKYTLTPQSMRQMEVPASPRRRTETQELADFFRDTAPPGHAKPAAAPTKPRTPVKGMNGLRANPPEAITMPPTPTTPNEQSRSVRADQPPPKSSTGKSSAGKSGRSLYQPRDAKVDMPSTRDLADFAKSTGPADPGQLPTAVAAVTVPPRRTKSVAARFQARDPIVRGPNSDLIDFIREGPPRSMTDNTHRIPRTVAPFRSTMDSDELNALGPPRDPSGRNSGSSNQDGSTVTKSTTNSRTALMDSSRRTTTNPSNSSNFGSIKASMRAGAEPTPPQRKQRRIRDPYAIDLGSDDEMNDGPGKAANNAQESLIDFLRNSSPPPDSNNGPQPLLVSSNRGAAQGPNTLKKGAAGSSGGLRDRLKRTASTHSLSRTGGVPTATNRVQATSRSGNQMRPVSPHLSQSGSRMDVYKPTQSTYAAHVDRNRQGGAVQNIGEDRDEGGVSKFFSRRRRVVA